MTRPAAEEIEQIRKIWARPETHENSPAFRVQREIWALLAEIDALREENQQLQHEVQWSRAAIAECLENRK